MYLLDFKGLFYISELSNGRIIRQKQCLLHKKHLTMCALCFYYPLFYILSTFMRNQRRVGEALMIACGIGIAVGAFSLGVMFLAYGGLAIAGLGVFSVFWR